MSGWVLVILFMLGAAILFVFLGISFYQKRLSMKNEEILFLEDRKSTKSRLLHSVYVFFSSFALTKNYIKRIRKRYEILEPGDIRRTEDDTTKTALLIWGISLGFFVIGALIDFSLITIAVCGILTYAISTSILFSSIQKKEIELAEQLDQFIDTTEHEYYSTNMIETTIENLCSDAPEPIRTHMEKIREILDNGDDQDITAYIETTPNKFLQLYLSACMLVNNYDDKKVDGVSLFVSNLNRAKTEIGIWLRSQKRIKHLFRFHGFMTISPLCCFHVIDQYVVNSAFDNASSAYYKGPYGIIVPAFICFASALIFNYTNRLKEMDYRDDNDHLFLQFLAQIPLVRDALDAYEQKNYGKKQKLNRMLHQMGANMNVKLLQVQRFLWMIGAFLISVVISLTIVSSSKEIALTSTADLESGLMYLVPDEETRSNYISFSSELTEQLKDENIDEELIHSYVKKGAITKEADIQSLITTSVYDRITKYQNTYFQWWYLIICALLGILGYQLPYVLILSRKDMMVIAQENEVIQFQSIISMLMHIEQITVEDTLEWLARFSILFKSSLDTCIADMAAGEEDALEKLKENEPYLPFVRIVDNLIDADKVGIENAFVEIDGDRESSQKKREQDSNMYIDKAANQSMLLSLLPLLLFITLYFCGPLMASSTQAMNALQTSISS